MTERDWYAPGGARWACTSPGDDIPGRDDRGEPIVDDSFLAVLHAGRPARGVHPARAAVGRAATNSSSTRRARTSRAAEPPYAAGGTFTLAARSVVLFRAVPG